MSKLLKFILITVVLTAFVACQDDSSDIIFNIENTTNNTTGGGDDDDPGTGGDPTIIEIGGDQTSDLALDGPGANEIYLLTSPLIMQDGTTLSITAGTEIRSNAGTNGYIAILQGAQIQATGTPSQPIVMTSNNAAPSAGDWGGLVILGRASINSGDTATSEVGNFTYGGTDDIDSSGNLQYVRLEYTGAAINSESEFNGISFYAVGNQTNVDFIEVFEGSDDGVEFFGGTVEANNVIIVNAQDDSLDWTEGWTGGITDLYIETSSDSDKVIEADGNEDDNTATPLSAPTITNFTAVGLGSAAGAEAVRLRRGTQATFVNVFIEGYEEAFDIDDPTTIDHVLNDETSVTDITFVDITTRLVSDQSSTSTDITEADLFSGISNGTATDVSNWGSGWSTLSAPSTSTAELTEVGDGSSDITLNAGTTYTLSGALVMQSGTTLTIPAGTEIRAEAGGTDVYIAIQQGAQINAQGTADNPIVMTSNANSPSAGDWGGLVILGNATINSGSTATSEVGNFTYGGSDDTDNSGTLSYVRLEYTGAAINSESEFNGVSFYAVGSDTTVEFIQVHEGADDGVEFFGGTVNASNVVITNAQDDSVDWTEGWRGTLTDAYIQTSSDSDKVIEADGNEDDNSATPLSSPTLINFTAIGLGSGQGAEAIRLRRGTEADFTNVYLQGYAEGFDIDDPLTVDAIINDISNVTNVTFDDITTNLVSDTGSDGTTTPGEADFFSGVGNGTQTDVATWGAGWTVGIN
ncbi:beta strand repeat-containing protein [Allomuricauda sp. SCSIO 65647]|uniref:beta strand repeat-containing protein n=1 Tax=Allomuricauda sp. SCSIO 65647 TaxID=2908843 RepID=UPI001F268DC2|nr:hypothetical protein [Muricauda sp. SCSIO 65647]UJH66200.1 hypothetical protein L0P89_09465 [Muricauda sp. SCSIO 65647]